MCKAKQYINTLTNLYSEMEKEYKHLSKENSRTDLILQDILHKIEFENFNACEGYKLAKQIKDIRNERRQYKDEQAAMESLMTNIKPVMKGLKSAESKVIEIENKQSKRVYKPKILNA